MAWRSPGWSRPRLLVGLCAATALLGFSVLTQGAAAKYADAKEAGADHFTVSASGDLLMHKPLLDRARANGSGGDYDFTPFFHKIKPYVAKVDLGLCHVETPMGPGPPTTYPIFNTPRDLAKSIRRSGWNASAPSEPRPSAWCAPPIPSTAARADQPLSKI